jgi:hypothetical protein
MVHANDIKNGERKSFPKFDMIQNHVKFSFANQIEQTRHPAAHTLLRQHLSMSRVKVRVES